jgi:glycosyltransferase involved in cell wall biosynthesis
MAWTRRSGGRRAERDLSVAIEAGPANEVEVLAGLSREPLDPGELHALLELWRSEDGLGLVAPRLTALVSIPDLDPASRRPRPGWNVIPAGWSVETANQALESAARSGRHLLCLLEALAPTADAIGALLQALGEDPHFGAAAPRLETPDGLGVLRLEGEGDGQVRSLPRPLLCELPSRYIVTERATPCVVIRWEVLANLGELDAGFVSLEGSLTHYLCRARRAGFRTVVVNRATVRPAPRPSLRRPMEPALAPPEDRRRLLELCPDTRVAQSDFRSDSFARHECLLARAAEDVASRTMLLDARNLRPGFNGTAQAILGIADGIHSAAGNRGFDLWVRPKAADFHGVEERYPAWRVHRTVPDRQYAVAFRLSQPWAVAEMIDLHRLALFNVYTMLDTIAWDTVYPAPPGLDGCWRFAARHADGFAFISAYARDRFLARFPEARRVPGLVTHLSCDPAEYSHPRREEAVTSPYWLVIGNRYDHKDVDATTRTLAQAFPFQSIVALGAREAPSPAVKVLESGELSESEIHGLYANASMVIYPSFYEGFGFPLVTALSYGRTVLARQSTLLAEVAALWTGGGRVVPFRTPLDLVERAGRLRHGQEVDGLPLGSGAPGGRPHRWRDGAVAVLGFVDQLSRDPRGARWTERESAVSEVLAYRG